jgi:predicted nucleotidyltransferase
MGFVISELGWIEINTQKDRGIERDGVGLMIDEQVLQQVVKRIVAASKPSRVIVFGSYGRDSADEDSDLDIMVIKPEVANKGAEMARLHEVVGDVGTGVDVLVYSDEEFERRSRVPGTVLYWARKEGRPVYEASH